MDETPPAADDPAPSLLTQIEGHRPHLRGRRWLRGAGAMLIGVLALVAIAAGVAGRIARRDAVALGERVAAAAAARDADQAGAGLFGSATVAEELAGLAAHLPAGAKLALVAREPSGALRIAIDAADPDALRQTLRSDAWFAAFRERGQAIGDSGAMRVTLERAP